MVDVRLIKLRKIGEFNMANIEIDGKQLTVDNGKTIIEVADENGIPIPRFCYHKKLAVAANCRMCLVEVEKSRKPLPACATTVTEGMKIYTKSPLAVEAQKAVMEFLLINHPLDCPICDQGGECELQDVSLSYGQDFSEYEESKRSVVDDNLGPLVATEMTRCIHCTRCVRFGEEIAGLREMGGTFRGEDMQIGTYVQHSLQSEISANIIDLCPVGALTSKPFQFRARAWELQQHPGIAPHDALGSSIEFHVRRDEVMRIVPKENESINETWISDRDRFSYLSIKSPNRLLKPMVKENGIWHEVDWSVALKKAMEGIQEVINTSGAGEVAAFASPSSTVEELYLLQKLMRSQGVRNLDHRLHQIDFSAQNNAPLAPVMEIPYADIENQQAILLIGTHLNHEQPLANVRVRKAFLAGAKVMAINSMDYDLHYDLAEKIIDPPQHLAQHLAQVVKVLAALSGKKLPQAAQAFFDNIEPEENASNIAAYLHNHKPAALILGALAQNHSSAGLIQWLSHLIGEMDVQVITMTTGANAAGAWLAGMVPHRGPMGHLVTEEGRDIQAALRARPKAVLMLNVDPSLDVADPHRAVEAVSEAQWVVMITSFVNDELLKMADVLLPAAVYAETSGTYVNLEGVWQTFKGVVSPQGNARPAWKILRVLGNLFHAEGFDYESSEEVLKEIKAIVPAVMHTGQEKDLPLHHKEEADNSEITLVRIGEWPIYRVDALCRYAPALQASAPGIESIKVRIHPETAQHHKITGEKVRIEQGDYAAVLPFCLDERVAKNAIYVPCGLTETHGLGHALESITLSSITVKE